jgi:hypothetical protein
MSTDRAFWTDRAWRRGVLRDAFGPSFWGFLAFAVVAGIVFYLVKGSDAFRSALAHDSELILQLLPRIVVALSIAALIWVMLPRDRLSAHVGAERGIVGLVIASLAGAVTLGLQRVLVWDVPFMGTEFAVLRTLISLPLPVLAGLIARRLPFDLRLREEAPAGSRL